MNGTNLFKIAFRALANNKLRAFLTMLGIIIGVASVIAMLAIGQGSKRSIQKQISEMGSNMIMIHPGAEMRGGVRQDPSSMQTLKLENYETLRDECMYLSAISPNVSASGQLISGSNNYPSSVSGVSIGYLTIRQLTVEQGEMFSEEDIRTAAKVCVIGKTIVETEVMVPGKNGFCKLSEIRIRINRPAILMYNNNKEKVIENIKITSDDIAYIIQMVTRYSMYAYQDSIRQGYVTVKGGHRIGVAGQAITRDGHICGQKYISYINIRVAHEVVGCADEIIDFICSGGFKNTLVVSPPGCGKTTILRDIIRHISYGIGCVPLKVAIVDERSEIASSHVGIPQNDIGIRTDVLDMGLKSEGMIMLVRSMSPQVVAVDEIGSMEDVMAIKQIINCGCHILASIHGYGIADCMNRRELAGMFGANGFERIVVLSDKNGAGTIEEMRAVKNGGL